MVFSKKGAEIIEGDITDPSSFMNIFNGVDVLLTAVHGMLGRGKNSSGNLDDKAHRQIIDAAKQAGVKHFIYTSIFGASPDSPLDFTRTKYGVEQYLINSGLTYTILRPTAFMEWHAYRLLGRNIIEKGKTTILGKGEDPVNFIAAGDVVAALEKIIETDQYKNTIITLAGPQNLTRNQVAELFGKAIGKTPKVGHVPIGILNLMSRIFQPFHPGIARIMRLTTITENTDQSVDPKYSIAQFGLQPTTMESFINQIINKGVV